MIKENPKILCGYSDITALLHTIYTKTGLVTYHGSHFCTFGLDQEAEYTQECFYNCVMNENSIAVLPSKTAEDYYCTLESVIEDNKWVLEQSNLLVVSNDLR